MNKKWMGSLLLLLTAMLWGFCFVVQRSGMEYVGPFTFGASRFLLGALALLPLALRPMEAGKRKKSFLAGLPCGVLLFLGSSLQQLGLQTTSAGKAGFLTALYIVLVPLLGLLAKQRVRATVWTAAMLGAAGLYLLCAGGTSGFASGDLLLILCALMFAFHIQLVGRVAVGTDGIALSCSQSFVTAGLSAVVMLFTETPQIAPLLDCLPMILYGGIGSIAIGYTLQIVAQRHTPPAVASVMMCLESAFAALSGWIFLGEAFNVQEGTGAALMLAAALLSQF